MNLMTMTINGALLAFVTWHSEDLSKLLSESMLSEAWMQGKYFSPLQDYCFSAALCSETFAWQWKLPLHISADASKFRSNNTRLEPVSLKSCFPSLVAELQNDIHVQIWALLFLAQCLALPASNDLILFCEQLSLQLVLGWCIGASVSHTEHADVAQSASRAEVHCHWQEGVWAASRHHELEGAWSVAVVQKIDGPPELILASIVSGVSLLNLHREQGVLMTFLPDSCRKCSLSLEKCDFICDMPGFFRVSCRDQMLHCDDVSMKNSMNWQPECQHKLNTLPILYINTQ